MKNTLKKLNLGKVRTNIKQSKWTKRGIALLVVCGIGLVTFEIMDEELIYAKNNPINNVLPLTTDVSKNEAIKIAEEQTNRLVDEVEVEIDENGKKVFQIEFLDDQEELFIDSDSGDVITTKDMEKTIKYTEEQVKEIALKETDGIITDFGIDENAGQYIYEIEVTDAKGIEMELDISALTGKIVKKELD
ncbi:MAG TPA: PepSY domain-containing protein [Niallia sp.]|nr:PepSY domain-containing protein [Niallia sp.]